MGVMNEDRLTLYDGLIKTHITNTTVAKEAGKGLSTNDYTTTEKNKLDGIADGANKTIVDSALDTSSENPVQNKVVKEQIDALTTQINNAIALRSSLEQYGMAKLSDSAAVTDSTGLALPATEKNATIEGTLANQIAQLNTDLIFRYHGLVEKILDIDGHGMWEIHNSSEMPSESYWYDIMSLGDRSFWDYHLIAFNRYIDFDMYAGRIFTNDGINFSFSGWKKIQVS